MAVKSENADLKGPTKKQVCKSKTNMTTSNNNLKKTTGESDHNTYNDQMLNQEFTHKKWNKIVLFSQKKSNKIKSK